MIVYASALAFNIRLLISQVALLILALGSGAAGVSLLNDWFDRDDDLKAQKHNRLQELSDRAILGLSSPFVGIALLLVFVWRDQPLLSWAYIACWVSFLLYSVPPIRLKARGVLGAIADALGSSLLPCILATGIALSSAMNSQIGPWLLTVSVWSLMFGLRGIAWHQIADIHNDRASGTTTWAMQQSPERVAKAVRYIIAPLEFAALTGILIILGSKMAAAALLAYGVFVLLKIVRFTSYPAIAIGNERTNFFLHDFYLVFLPAALLVELASQGLMPWWGIGIHVLIFLPTHLTFLREVVRLIHH